MLSTSMGHRTNLLLPEGTLIVEISLPLHGFKPRSPVMLTTTPYAHECVCVCVCHGIFEIVCLFFVFVFVCVCACVCVSVYLFICVLSVSVSVSVSVRAFVSICEHLCVYEHL